MSAIPGPSTLGPDGKDSKGRFGKGNKLGRGNPLAGRAAKIRAQLLQAMTATDTKAIVKKLIDMAKAGDLAAIKELLDRTIGKPSATELIERIEKLERVADGGGSKSKWFIGGDEDA